MTQLQTFAIGLASDSLETFENLGIPHPMPHFQPYVEGAVAASGKQLARGFPQMSLEWGLLMQEQRDILRVYIPGPSAEIFMSLPVMGDSDEWLTFSGVAVWPFPEAREPADVHNRINFVLLVRQLVQVSV